jgi:hypothetical protein
LTVGSVVRLPGIFLTSSSVVSYQSGILTPPAAVSTFLRDENGQFEYRQPLEVSFGFAWRIGPVHFEGDARWHASAGSYDLYRPSTPLQVTTQNPDGTTSASTQPLAPMSYATRPVWNFSAGGNVGLGRIATLHLGFYNSRSPVENPAESPLRKANLYGITGGVDFQFERFGFSVGLGWEFGSSPTVPLAFANGQAIGASSLELQSISILYAISYSF